MKLMYPLCAAMALWAIALFPLRGYAQGTIRGTVINKINGLPISGALLVARQTSEQKRKNNFRLNAMPDGTFVMENIPDGFYDIECTQPGFVPQRLVGVEVKKGATKLAYFKLREGVAKPNEVDIFETQAAILARMKRSAEAAELLGQNVEDAPATLYVFTKEDIAQHGYMSLDELLLDVPEIQIEERADGDTYNLVAVRGIDGNEKVIVMIDGVRVTSLARSRMPVWKNFNIRYAEQVEIIIGSAGAVHGADAFSGVIINIQTKSGFKDQNVEAVASGGQYWTTDNSIAAAWNKGKFAISAMGSGYYSREPNLAKAYSTDFSWYNEQYQPFARVLALDNDRLDMVQTSHVEEFNMPSWAYSGIVKIESKSLEIGLHQATSMTSSAVSFRPEFFPYTDEAKIGYSLTNAFAKYNLQSKTPNLWKLKLIGNYNLYQIMHTSSGSSMYTDYNTAFRYARDQGGRVQGIFTYQPHKNHHLAVQADVTYAHSLPKTADLSRIYRVFRSADAQNVSYIGSTFSDSTGRDLSIPVEFFQFDFWNIGGMLQYQTNLGEKLYFTASSRIDYNTKFGLNINPRGGFVYKPNEWLRVKLFYGEGFLPPTSLQLYEHHGFFRPTKDSLGRIGGLHAYFFHLPNPNLKAQKSRSAEATISVRTQGFFLSANAFYNRLYNYIDHAYIFNGQYQGVPVDLIETRQNNNTLQVYTYGGTLRGEYQRSFGKNSDQKIRIYAAYTHMNGKTGTAQVAYTARHSAKGGITFEAKRWSADLRGVFRGVSYQEATVLTDTAFAQIACPASFVLNTHLRYKIIDNPEKSRRLEAFVKINNLLNARYYNLTVPELGEFNTSPQNPIRVMLGVSYALAR